MKKGKSRNKRKKTRSRLLWIAIAVIGIAAVISAVCVAGMLATKENAWKTPEELLVEYMDHIPKQEYEEMYAMLHIEASGNVSQEDFVTRNSAIYEGIEVQNIAVQIIAYDEEQMTVTYQTSFDTVAGTISFENKALFLKDEEGYQLVWDDSLIFPNLASTDKVRVSTTQAERGEILDRNGRVLAGKGTASSVGIVPGKLENREEAIAQIAELVEITPEAIEKKLSAKWVKDDSFVPIKTIPRVEEIELMSISPDEEVLKEKERHEKLLEIPGVMISDVEVREYPLGEAAAHLVGYVQSVTAEDLEEHAGEGYTANSVIGRSGMESLFESELKGQNGCRIYIENSEGKEKEELACILVQHGQDIQLTIDTDLQVSLHEQFKEDKSCSVAMNPYIGEVLALVSTPAYDNNDFIMGLSSEQWTVLNEDENKPMYNRFRQVWCPGSTFKPITAAVGLESGAIDPMEDYGNVGLSWQKDASWGSYHVTTLHAYEPVILENALIYSDNIYFAKAALKIGSEEMESSLTGLGFNEELPFEIKMAESQYSNSEGIETEIQLADSGYGQGQVLVNPLHMACIYSAFCNEGNVIKPYLVYQKDAVAEYWIPGAFSNETASRVLEGTKKVVNDSNGTGYAAHRDDILLAGKTGTAEIKASKDDTSGTELGWFAIFTAEDTECPILIISMVEDVKGRGGSGYVVKKDSLVWKSGLAVISFVLMFSISGCSDAPPEENTVSETVIDVQAIQEESEEDADEIISVCIDLYEKAEEENKLADLETIRSIVNRLGENGYSAVDSRNQINMTEPEKVVEFCEKVDAQEEAEITILEISYLGGFVKYDLHTKGGNVDVVRSYYKYENGNMKREVIGNYQAEYWNYTEEGYLMFSGVWFSEELYVLTLSGAEEHTALRVQPLDETYRELSRKYLNPISFERNNMFIVDWSEEDFGDLNFYDMYDILYPKVNGQYAPYVADDNLSVSAVYQIPKEEFESVIMKYFNIDSETLQSKTIYDSENLTYEYKPRGFEEVEYPEYPYSEVVGFTENNDGTITLTANVVFPYAGDSKVYAHEVVVRPLENGRVQYVSNRIIPSEDNYRETWHTPRLTLEEWEELYGGE